MELFQTYEEEWTANTQGLEEQIAQVPTLSGKERDSLVKTIRERLLDAEDSVDGMGIACRGTKEEKDLAARLKTYRSELDEFKRSLQRSQHAINPNAQRDLLGGDEHDFGTSAEHRALFGGQNETQSLMSAGDDLILQATRDTLEIEETAMQVMQDLSDQRTVMERFQDRLNDINESLDSAGRLMQQMMRRLCGNKAMMAVAILILIGGVIAIIWLRFFPPWADIVGHGNTTSTTAATSAPTRERMVGQFVDHNFPGLQYEQQQQQQQQLDD